MNIYISRENQTSGPYNEAQVSEMIQSGTLVTTDLCSVDGTNWQPISDFTQADSPPAVAPQTKFPPPGQSKPQTTKKTAAQVPKKTPPNKATLKPEPNTASAKKKKSEDQSIEFHANDRRFSEKLASKDSKKEYLNKLRSETLYPSLRIFFKIVFLLQLIVGIIFLIGGVVNTIINEFEVIHMLSLLLCLISGIFLIATAFITKESGALLIDIADSQIETNSRNNI